MVKSRSRQSLARPDASRSPSSQGTWAIIMWRYICFAFLFTAASGHRVPAERACRPPLVRLSDGNLMPRFGFGTWLGFDKNEVPIPVTDDSVRRSVEAAIEEGYRHIDTASIYHDEDQVGEAISKKLAEGVVKREDLFITTKLWNNAHASGSVVPALQESLRRLNLTYVDLYLMHYPIATATMDFKPYVDIDYLEAWRGMEEAKKLGLAKSIGICNFNLQQLERLWGSCTVKPAVLQIETNLNLQQPELRKYCHDRDIAVMGYTPFGSLFPARAKPDAPPPRADDPALLHMAAKYNKTVPQVVLRYMVELGVTPIPKSVKRDRIAENLDIFDFQLDEFDRRQLATYHNNYRTIPVTFFRDSPYYPF